MKKYFVFFFYFTVICNAQWQPDVRLTNDSSYSQTSWNNAWCIASSGNDVHIVWVDNRDGNDEVYYKRSTDEGVNWSADIRFTNNDLVDYSPSIAVSGKNLGVVWHVRQVASEPTHMYYLRSTDGGLNWGVATQFSDEIGSWYPVIAVSGTATHLTWAQGVNPYYSGPEIFYMRSLDGTNWGPATQLTANDSDFSYAPSITVSNSPQSSVHIVWHDERDENKEIYYKRSANGGSSWGQDIRLTNNSAVSSKPCVAVSPQGEVHVVWQDNRNGQHQIFYKRSADDGMTWGNDIKLAKTPGTSLNPSIAVSDSLAGRVHLIWVAGTRIYYQRSTDGGVNWDDEIQLTNFISGEGYQSIVGFPRGGAQLVWTDNRNGNFEIYYKRNLTGNVTGIDNMGSEFPEQYHLEQNYPNPFNPVTTIRYTIPTPPSSSPLAKGRNEVGFVTLKVYDVLGKEVATLVNEEKAPGTYEVEFNEASSIRYPASGIYFYQLKAGDPSTSSGQVYLETKKMILMK